MFARPCGTFLIGDILEVGLSISCNKKWLLSSKLIQHLTWCFVWVKQIIPIGKKIMCVGNYILTRKYSWTYTKFNHSGSSRFFSFIPLDECELRNRTWSLNVFFLKMMNKHISNCYHGLWKICSLNEWLR